MLKPLEFWVAVFVAVIVKIKTSRSLGPWQVITTVVVAVGAAYVASDWVSERAGLSEPVAAALVGLTAEGVMRWILQAIEDPKATIALLKEWRK